MVKKSDYLDPRTNLYERLPGVFQSQTNESVFENVFNRFLSKPQIELVDGFAGEGFNNAEIDRRIVEPTPHRQAFQLQPLLHAKVGSVTHLASSVDILNETERLGINNCRLPLWGNALQFNWAPPIDIDKLVNFRDYYWYDSSDPTALPQYITIESLCIKAAQRTEAYEETVTNYGDLQPILSLDSSTKAFTIADDLSSVFTDGYVFFVTNSTNTTINVTFWTVASSTYDIALDLTTIIVDEAIGDDSIVDGDISLGVYLTVLQSEQQCACGGDLGWDVAPWDDNQVGSVLWSTGLLALIQWATEAEWITANQTGSPLSSVDDLSIWYDTTNNQLKQYYSGAWNIIQNNFSAIVVQVEGTHLWDFTSTCVFVSNPWSDQNLWYHKNHVPNFAIAKQATLPIIEYEFGAQLNRWTFTDYVWKYRQSDTFSFAATSTRPTLNELIPFSYVIDVGLSTITLSPEVGDQTGVFVAGYQFQIRNDSLDSGNNGTFTVESSSYTTTSTTPGDENATVVVIEEVFSSDNQSTTSTSTSPIVVGSGGEMVPRLTSIGDFFVDHDEHWLLDDSVPGVEPATGKLLPVATPPPTTNPYAELDPLSVPTTISEIGEYLTSEPVDLTSGYGVAPYVLTIEYTILPQVAPLGVPAGTVIPLDPRMISRAPIDETSVRVVHNGQQIYGTFNELDSGIGAGSPFLAGSPQAFVGSPLLGANDGFVDSITLAFDLETFDTLRITVAEQSVEDMGRAAVSVRTIEDDTAFALTGSPEGSQPETVSLIQYRHVDPLKTATNEYPLFDIFDCEGVALNIANEIFKWKESQDNSTNSDINLRIVGTTTSDYEFENLLIDETTLPRPVLYSYVLDGVNQTVWRKGLNDEEYTPSYVDADKDSVSVGSSLGAWEVPDQLYFNAEHENRQYVTFPDVVTHFRTILDEQNDFPGVALAGSQAYLHEEYNYGLGGRIKEFNDSYDTFLSSIFVNNVSPPGIIDFAHDQYENSLNTIKELYRSNLLTFLTNATTSSVLNLQTTINTNVINQYELNDFFALVYGDSNSFVAGSPELGVRNWPATLPLVGLGFKKIPYVIEDETLGLLQLIHHDGHRSEPSLTTSTRESVIQTLLNTSDARVTGETWGVQQTTTPPDLYSDLQLLITPRSGIYWYSVIAGVRTLYRFVVASVGAIAPSDVGAGALWYDTSTDLLKELQSDLLTWNQVEGSPSAGIITQAWEEINFDELLINLQLEVETRLYEVAPTLTSLDFAVSSTLTSDISCPSASTIITDSDTGDLYFQEAFSTYLRDREIDDAYSADQYYTATDPFTWNYSFSTVTTRPALGSPQGTGSGGWWTDVYQNLYGTPYPHLEPWVLQGYTGKPSWWDAEYLNDDATIYGTRRWKHIQGVGSPLPAGMWEQIQVGSVPVGQLLPDGTTSTGAVGEVQTWNYFSVNISDATIDSIESDGIFPPFWDYVANGGTSLIRSVFSDFGAEILLPSADYTFSTGGPVNVTWEQSSRFLYDGLLVGFRMQPVRFIHSTLGVNFLEVGGLQINEDDCKVYSHRDVLFHGDIINTNELFQVDGINQWYVNFNRFNSYDVAFSDFRTLWSTWEPLLTYQFASIIDTQTLQVLNTNFDITERDYSIILKKSPGIESFFLDAFNVNVLESPNKLARYDTQSLWKFQLSTFFPTTRSLSYYEVHNYPVRADTLTNTFNLYRYELVDVDAVNSMFFLAGDQTEAFTTSQDFTIIDSTGNDGTYTATNIAFNVITDQTVITVAETLDIVVDGSLVASYRTHPWSTGDKIEFTSTQTVPAPLVADKEYYVINIDDVTFQVASTLADAIAQRNIIISSDGAGQVHTGQVFSKFVALDGTITNRQWTHYLIDTRFTRTFTPPQRVTGIQTLINLIDGYAVVTGEAGWIINLENHEQDADTGQPITWALEMERFIDQIFRLPQQRASLPDTYPVSVDSIADTLTFTSTVPTWTTSTKVNVVSGVNGALPAPLLQNQIYYVISVSDGTIQLALTAADALLEQSINILGGGAAIINIFEAQTPTTRHPSIEINPFRNNLWLETPQGILSNVVDGPTDDIRNTQLITDQAGNQLTGKDISVFRWDKLARIYVPTPIANPAVAARNATSYNSLHLSSAQMFVDGYECVVLFNDYADDGTLVYDPFIGLNTLRFSFQFFRQDEFTQRPVVGGYFLTPDDEILRNIESGVLDLQNLYDTHRVLETTPTIREGRKTIDYRESEQSFLDEIGLNPKSKFLFWKGMIQNKGSVKSVTAFTNSAKFDDAIVDEFWAYKVANFGTSYEQVYPALNLVIDDSRRSDKRIEFLTSAAESAASTFEGILLTNQTRWHSQPDVLKELEDNNSSFYFDTKVTSVQTFTGATQEAGSPIGAWYVETDVPFDDVILLRVDTNSNTVLSELTTGSPAVDYEVINSSLIKFATDPATLLGGFGSPFVGGSPNSEEYRLYTINPAEDKINPSKVIDVKDGEVVDELPLWDPRRNLQYATANNIVTLESSTDPATYTNALDSSNVDTQFWNAPEVGITWWDTNERNYVPYHDSNIFQLDERIQNWGKLADWSTINLYQWTESDILPSAWDAVAGVEELDVSIDSLIRKTGRAKAETYQRERTAITVVDVYPSTTNTGSPTLPLNVIIVSDADGVLALDDKIVFTTDDELPLPLQNGVFYYIVSIDSTVPALTEITVSLEESGSVLDITPGSMIVDLTAVADVQNPASVGTNSTGLTNDFDTSGAQTVTFTISKSLGSSTGLTLGTRGYQEVSYTPAIATGTPTGLSIGGGGYQVISGWGSPVICGATAGLTGPGLYTMIGSVDGGAPVTIYIYEAVTNTLTYSSIAGTIGSYLSGATASCDPGSNGIIVQSNSVGPGSTISLSDVTLVAALSGSLDAAVSGSVASTYEATITIDGSDQTLVVSGDTAQTFGALALVMNNQLTGSSTSIIAGDLRITSNSTGTSSTVLISDVDLFSSISFGSPQSGTIETGVVGTSVFYQTNIAVNGGSLQSAVITGDEAQTFAQLIEKLNQNIIGQTSSLLSGSLKITSNTSGSSSTIDVIDGGLTLVGSPLAYLPGLLESLSSVEAFTGTVPTDRRPSTSPVDGADATTYTTELDFGNGVRLITVIGNEAQNWNQLLSTINSQLPTGAISTLARLSPTVTDLLIDAGNNTVAVTNDNLFTRLGESLMGSPLSENGIYFNQFISQHTGDGTHQVLPPFSADDWIQLDNVWVELIDSRDKNNAGQFDLSVAGTTPNNIAAADTVNTYANGTLLGTGVTVGTSGLTIITGTNQQDFIVARKAKHVITTAEEAFDPDVFDDGSNLIQYKEDYNYSTTSKVNDLGVEVPVYHFWVENKTTREGDNVSMLSAVSQLETIPTPYMIVDNLVGELFGSPITYTGSPQVGVPVSPRRYTQLILRGLAGVVDDVDRYVLRFTRDFSLRDNLDTRNYTSDLTTDFLQVGTDPLDLKSNHTEWALIRENQPVNIPRALWNRVTESMIAEKIDDATTRVPALSREVYDVTFGTDTRYGLGTEQAFVNGALAKATLIADLLDPTNDFSPVDINTFFAAHNFDTTAGLKSVMDDIYNTFSFTSVNRIYFKILLDAFTTKQNYEEIFKTSWVALSGTQIFQTEELYSG